MRNFRIVIKFLLLLVPFSFFGQVYQGKVVDEDNYYELNNVSIQSIEHKEIHTITNSLGEFTLTKPGKYSFSKKGFISDTLIISTKKFIVIVLKKIPENLAEITITTSNLPTKLKSYDGGITIVNKSEINLQNNTNIAPILNAIPGVLMQQGTLNTNRITIRGIGSRTPFGTSKIRAYYQDIPLTNGSGESTMEDLELNAIGKMEVQKGPSSSAFGAGLGGNIHWIPDAVQLGLGNQTNTANMIYSNTKKDGYRDNNQLDKQVFTAASQHFINNKNDLNFIVGMVQSKAYIPSSLDYDTYINSPKSAAYTWASAKGNEDYKKGLFGISWKHLYNNKLEQHTSVFYTYVENDEDRPFNILAEKTNAIGIRSRLISNTQILQKETQWTLGFEFFNDLKDFQTFENLYQDFPPGTGSVSGKQLSNFSENRKYFNLFFDSKITIFPKTKLHLGLNWNKTKYDLKDQFYQGILSASGHYSFDGIISPKIGITYQTSSQTMVYATASHGFSPPSLEETLLPNGQINTNIKPETGWNLEIGSRGNLFQNVLFYDIALYQMQVKNQLVARRINNDEFVGVNAGKTDFLGAEAALNFSIYKTSFFKVFLRNAINYYNFKFKEFIDLNQDFSGNDLTGMPKFTYNFTLDTQSTKGLYGNINYYFVGKIPVNDANSVYTKKYQLLHAKIGYRKNFSSQFQADIFTGINNILNEKYAAMLQINASSFGNNAPRYYYPGEPTNYYLGANFSYTF